jgi:hypothetical protein
MFDLNKLIVEAYEEEKSKDFSFDRLVEMVETVMAMQESLGLGGILKEEQINQVLQNAQKQAESELPAEWHKLLPKIEISERWGVADPTGDNEARQQFETYMSAIGGSTVKEKLTNIATFVNNKTQDTDTRKVLSNIIFLDLLSTVVNNFSPSGSGFLFEAFLAGLLGGTQMVGKTEEGVLDIDDLVDAEGRPISLKLLTPTTGVKGSIENLLKFLAHSSKAQEIGGGIIYLCVYKYGRDKTKALGFYEFTIDGDNIYYWLADEFGFKTTFSESMINERRMTQEPTVAGKIGVRGISKYNTLMKTQAANDDKIKKAAGMKPHPITANQLLGKTEEAKQKFAAAASDINALQAYKTAIEGLGIKIPSEVAFDDTLFTDKTDEQINNIYLARKALEKQIKNYLKRTKVGDDKKALYNKAAADKALAKNFLGTGLPVAGVAPDLQPAIDQLTSREARDGMKIMQGVAQDYGYESPTGLRDYSAAELKKMGGQGIIDVLDARKKARSDLRTFVRPDNPYMGYFKQTFTKADQEYLYPDSKVLQGQAFGTPDKMISYLQTLYKDSEPNSPEREEWLNSMLARYKNVNLAGAAKKKKKKKKNNKEPEAKTPVSEGLLTEATETQFEINSDLITKTRLPAIYKQERLGVLKIDDESVKELAASYAEGVLRDIAKLFVALDKVTKGLTGYFLSDKDRFASASNTLGGMKELQDEVTKQVKTSETT